MLKSVRPWRLGLTKGAVPDGLLVEAGALGAAPVHVARPLLLAALAQVLLQAVQVREPLVLATQCGTGTRWKDA